MYYRVSVHLAFPDASFAQSIFNHAKGQFSHAVTINPGTPQEEKGFIKLEICHHDAVPPRECESISQLFTL